MVKVPDGALVKSGVAVTLLIISVKFWIAGVPTPLVAVNVTG